MTTRNVTSLSSSNTLTTMLRVFTLYPIVPHRCANNSIADGLEELYADAHAKIRENPNLEDPDKDTRGKDYWKAESEKYRLKKISREEKKANVQKRIAELRK